MDYTDAIRGLLRGRGDDVGRAAKVTANIDPNVARYLDELAASGRAAAPQAPDLSLGSPEWHAMDKSARAYDNVLKGRTANLRNQDPGLVQAASQGIRDAGSARAAQVAGDDALAKGVGTGLALGGAGAGAAYLASQSATAPPDAGAMTSTGGTAELANESRPVPEVKPDEDAEAKFTEKFKRQYTARENKRQAKGEGGYANTAPAADPRAQARQMIDQLNAMRRKAGGEVPEAKQMLSQINSLLAQADQQANARSLPQRQAAAQASPNDPHAQASVIIGQLNQMYRQGLSPSSPQAQQMMAEVRRLHAMGDQQRNGR